VRAAWARFWFTAEPVWPIWAYRFGLSAWTVAFFLPRIPYLDELYGSWPVHQPAPPIQWIGAPVFPLIVVQLMVGTLLGLLVLFAFGVGRHPRILHVAIGILLVYLLGYDHPTIRGYGKIAALQWVLLFVAPYDRPPGDRAPRWAKRLLMLQFSSVYVFTVLAKLVQGRGWDDGQTLYWALTSPQFGQHLVSDWVTFTPAMTAVLGWMVLASELFVGIGLWFRPTRKLAILACIGLHLGMALTLRVSLLFHALMWLHLVLFVSGPEGDRRT
jgi:hypothetical protein